MTLMGVSGGVYVGNEIATENVWKKLEDKVEKAENKFKEWKKNKPEIGRVKEFLKQEKEKLKGFPKTKKEECLKIIAEEEEKLNNLVTPENEYKELKDELYKELEKIFGK